jgi:GDP-L-fucose synthase
MKGIRDWKGRRVVVTGGTGFLGRHLVARLAELGADVAAPSSSECNLLRYEDAMALLRPVPDAVFHLAARVGGIGANREHPGTFFRDTLRMGMNVLDAARERRVGRLLQVGTVAAIPSTRRCRSAKRTCGPAIRRRPTRRTASPSGR